MTYNFDCKVTIMLASDSESKSVSEDIKLLQYPELSKVMANSTNEVLEIYKEFLEKGILLHIILVALSPSFDGLVPVREIRKIEQEKSIPHT